MISIQFSLTGPTTLLFSLCNEVYQMNDKKENVLEGECMFYMQKILVSIGVGENFDYYLKPCQSKWSILMWMVDADVGEPMV